MFLMMLLINMLASFTFLFMNHPLSMGFILLIQTILIALMSGMMTYSFWFSYMLFLIMLGGMLVLFLYMTSLASNEMFQFSMKLVYFYIIFTLLMMLMLILTDNMYMSLLLKNYNYIEIFNNIMLMKNENLITLNKIYNIPNNMITILLINYLFITLIAVVKITNINQGPLRQKI
uniref:NADH-ubiquinone oxidoreductase chain 6 n=1 Tax=Omus cazieri TaxID=1343352 RepID=A0A343EYS0_9CARA|nr:NADH dehydrogenase subunit 6 [Omus cazieri]